MLGPQIDCGQKEIATVNYTITLTPTQLCHLKKCREWFNDPRITRYFPRICTVNEETELDWYKRITASKSDIIWSIMLQEGSNKHHVGQTGIRSIDWINGTGDTGTTIDPQWWNKGIATIAMKARGKFAFGQLRLSALYTEICPENVHSIRAAETAGYEKYGIKPYFIFRDGQYLSSWLGVLTPRTLKG
ncbi:MAG: N-acetyltransferase GCN5 [Candidatus Berkelbacteria bacterium Licking1014_2]|uniref:N-acetyltransferase GCN5 n=1 Tax=Candidatus Berkelbacteria bacterium Licking1014_2 TaxID=2017146 RepID=A0A554LX19_9BACT|nr:MAG: N-acetyltransferase GCN5 [Candidatus Berkelbacteria bacterium Licking1014_2]